MPQLLHLRTSIAFILLCLAVLLISAEGSRSQNVSQLQLNHLTLEDGLSQSSGMAILQDHEGYMWFGTQNGLNKYNGYDITVYKHNPSDSTTISGSNITSLFEDSNGNLWIGTSGSGLNRYDRETDTFVVYKDSNENIEKGLSDIAVTDILEDNSGRLWIGTIAGLNRFDRDKGEFIHYYADENNPNSLSSSAITVLYEDKHNHLWIGTEKGLNYWDDSTNTFKYYSHEPSDPNSLSHPSVSEIYEDKQGNLWVGTLGGGLNRFDRDEEKFYRFLSEDNNPDSINGNNIFSILEDSRGILWIGTENEGLNIFDRKEEIFYHYKSDVRNPHSLTHNSVYSLYENRDNILWIGVFSGSISYLDRKYPKFEHYKHDPFAQNPLSNNSVISFLETENETFLVGTDGGGLNVFDRASGDFYPYQHDPENPKTLSSDVILALHQDQNGRIWIGYYNGGITMYNPKTENHQHFQYNPQDPSGLNNNHIFVIQEERDGTLYFGTNGGGINQLDPESGRISQFGSDYEKFNATVIRAITEDSDGNLWIGTYGGGAILLDKEDGSILQQFMEGPNGLTSNVILSIHEDRQQNLWFGTIEGGLHQFNRSTRTFQNWSVEDGLASPVIQAILEDDHGNLWMSTLNGLSKFNPEDESFENYSVEHGIQNREFNPLSAYKDEDGYMYFGGINGFNRFHPDSITINTEVPPVVLTDFKIFNRSVQIGEDTPLKKHVSQTEQITVPYNASVLTFDYVALNFNEKKGDRFAYMLEGFDQDWNYVELQRSATYTNLDPGEYIFKVKAANSDGVWSESNTSLTLIITPPFWRTTLFYLLVAAFIAGIVTVAYRMKVRSITKQNKRLEKEVARQTSELFDKNKELETTLEELKNTRGELVEKAHKAGMADLATNVLHNVGNILNSVNVSANLIDQILSNSKLRNLKKANEMLRENLDNMEHFILNDPKGKTLLQYYLKLEEPLEIHFEELKTQKKRLADNINLIIDVVSSQQSYSKAGGVFEWVSVEKVMEDTLKLQSGSIERHGMHIKTEFQKTDQVEVEKSKMIHSLVNLLNNAKEAMANRKPGEKELILKSWQDEEYVHLSVSDNGIGINNENINKIFNHGFTTRSNGHGFGLHSCANYMQEIGGEISVKSKGINQGSTFILSFPKASASTEKEKRFGQK